MLELENGRPFDGYKQGGLRYIAILRDDESLRARVAELAAKQRAHGHPLLHATLRREGLVVKLQAQQSHLLRSRPTGTHEEPEQPTTSQVAHRVDIGSKPALLNGLCVRSFE